MHGEFLDLLAADPEDVAECGLSIELSESLKYLHGGHTWNAALRMGTALSVAPWSGLMRSKRILELGSGTGVVGMLAARIGGPHATVRLTDGDAAVATALAAHIATNSMQAQCSSSRYEWGGDALTLGDAPYDVILVADCLYSKRAVGELCDALDDLVRPGITRVLCSCEERWGTTDCLQVLARRQWDCIERDGAGFPDTLVYGEAGTPPREGTFHMFELRRSPPCVGAMA
jgi:predicted nicotinamide N-methyase